MAETRRLNRINRLILEEVAKVVQREIEDPAVTAGFVTVVGVKTSPDLTNSTVFISSLGDESRKRAALDALNHAAAFIRNRIKPFLTFRIIPKLEFKLDETAEKAVRISALLRGTAAADEDFDGE